MVWSRFLLYASASSSLPSYSSTFLPSSFFAVWLFTSLCKDWSTVKSDSEEIWIGFRHKGQDPLFFQSNHVHVRVFLVCTFHGQTRRLKCGTSSSCPDSGNGRGPSPDIRIFPTSWGNFRPPSPNFLLLRCSRASASRPPPSYFFQPPCRRLRGRSGRPLRGPPPPLCQGLQRTQDSFLMVLTGGAYTLNKNPDTSENFRIASKQNVYFLEIEGCDSKLFNESFGSCQIQ